MRPVLFVVLPMPSGGMAEALISTDPALGSMPIGQRLRDVRTANCIGACEIRDSPRNSQNSGSASAGKPQSIHGLLDQLHRIRCEMDRVAFDLCIAWRTGRSVAVAQGQPGAIDSFRDHRARLAAGSMGKLGGGSGLNLHRQVDPIKDRSTDTVAVILTAT